MTNSSDEALEVKQITVDSPRASTTQLGDEILLVPPVAAILYGAAVVLMLIAFNVAYQDSSYGNRIVGGDAYNFIIFAGRGMVWAAAAIVTAIAALGWQIAGHVSRLHGDYVRSKIGKAA